MFRQKRPNSNKHDSFPSTAATVSFAIAVMQAEFRPREAWIWYTGATAICLSRLALGKHYSHDILGGALLGYGIAQLNLRLPKGLLLAPLLGPAGEPGVQAFARF